MNNPTFSPDSVPVLIMFRMPNQDCTSCGKQLPRKWRANEKMESKQENGKDMEKEQCSISCATALPAVVDSKGPSSIIKGPKIRSFVAKSVLSLFTSFFFGG